MDLNTLRDALGMALEGLQGPPPAVCGLMEEVESFRAAVSDAEAWSTDSGERRAADQAAADEALSNVGDVGAVARGGMLRIPTKYNIKCSGCGVVMPEVFFNAWREVSPGVWSPFCNACRPGR